jgi:competence protein ComFC
MNPTQAQPIAGLLRPLQNLFSDLLDLVFPPRCENCGRVDTAWCDDCLVRLQAHPLFIRERHNVAHIPQLLASGVHEGLLQTAIHAFKYHQQPQLGMILGERLARLLPQNAWQIDLVTPVPLHASRMKKRGYNQSEVLGNIVAQSHAIPLNSLAILRERETRQQVGLNRAERMVNVADAFRATDVVIGKTLLIVDDVVTTGSTLSACADAALQGGAKRVYALTLAVAHD